MSVTSSGRHDGEAGAVMVMVALLLPLLVIFTSFAVDAAHFWDFSRNLQNRADAAAFAAGDTFGGTCFGSPTGTQLDDIGHAAQQYSGPPGSPPGSGADLPYPYTDVSNYQNTLNNPGADSTNFHLRLNASASADHGGVNFEMGNFCNATYTDPSGPAADVWVTQEHVPLFFPLLGFKPNISAHARVSLEGEAGGSNIRPIAVSDPGAFGCVTVKFRDSGDNSLIATQDLTETDPTNFVWQSAAPVPSLHMPANGDSVYMQAVLSDCSGNGQTYDDSTNTGIELINSYGTGTPAANQPPKVTSVTIGTTNFHGVTLSGSCSAGDQYFYVSPDGKACNVQPQAVVAFNVSGSSFKKGDATVTAVDTSTGASISLTSNNTGTVWTPNGNNSFSIADSDGLHPIRIDWTQTTGAVNGVTCGPGGPNKLPPCTGSLGVQAQAFGACNGCDQPNDSGPIILSQLHLLADVTGDNSFQQDTSPQLYVKLQLAGIRAQTGAAAPDVILRFSGSTNHQTGLVDCGQGNGPGGSASPADGYTIYGGCGPNNPFELPQCTSSGLPCKVPPTGGFLNPLFVYARGSGPTDCSPAVDQNYTDWPSGNHQDCVKTTPGTRRVSIICSLLQRITGVQPAQFNPNSSFCNSNNPATCPTNNWPNTNVPGDHRKIDVVLTAPLDLAAADGSPQYWIPIRKFATFYVTGWDQSLFPKCGKRGAQFGENDDFPGTGKNTSQNGALWGHWIKDVDPGGTPDGNPCDLSSIEPVNCVPALTR